MATAFLNARVIYKVATEAEWEAITLDELIKGEFYVYHVEGDPNIVTNIKIGDGVRQPRDLPYFWDASIRIPIFGSATPSSTPTPASGDGFWFAGAGTYTNYGGVTIPANNIGVIMRVGGTYSSFAFPIDLSGYTTKDEFLALSNKVDEISSETIGGSFKIGANNPSSYISPSTNTTRTYILADSTPSVNSLLSSIQLNSVAAGAISIKVYSKIGNTVTLIRGENVTLALGKNTINIATLLPNWTVPSGALLGFSWNTTSLLGRVGFSTTLHTPFYQTDNAGTGSFELPAPAIGGGWGINFTFNTTDSLKQRLDKIDANPDNGIVYDKWLPQLGGLVPDYTSNAGYVTIDTTTGNQNIFLENILPENKIVYVKLVGKVVSGANTNVSIGLFASSPVPATTQVVSFTSVEQEFIFKLTGVANADLSLGVIAANNNGSVLAFKNFTIYDQYSAQAESLYTIKTGSSGIVSIPVFFNTEEVFSAISKYDKPLTKILVLGDSLMANYIGGAVPPEVYEGDTNSPIRLKINNIARRLYDLLSWNKAQWFRLNSSQWTKSGTWSTVNNTTIFEPVYPTEYYHENSTSGAYVEITVPDGMENFAFVYQEQSGYSPLTITLNGGDISSYGQSVINPNVSGIGHTGNPYAVSEYIGLPAGTNVIRITRDATTSTSRIWGGFYWTGNTMMVINASHGGHTLNDLLVQHIDGEVVRNKPDAILFELTIMNDAGRVIDAGNTIAASQTALRTILDTKIEGKDMLIMSCNPYGTDPVDGTPNYYTMYPGMEEMKNALKQVVYERGIPFADVFEVFKRKIINRGGTLEGGQGGIWYTHDGQHGNPDGVREWWNIIKGTLNDNPIIND